MKTFLKKACTVLLAGALLVPSLASGSKAFADENKLPSGTPTAQIGQKIEDYVDQHKDTTAGMATAVFDKNGIIYQGNFGYIDKEKKIAVDDDTVFEWGSVTKLTVWTSVMQLWEEGKIDLEEDVRNYLPKGFLTKLRFDKPITMIDLMNHQAGFEESFLDLQSKDSLEETLKKYQPNQIFAPKDMASYSNFGIGLAAYIVERVSGQSFADYAHEHIFKPLGMTKTALLPDLSDNDYVFKKHKEVKGYTAQGQKINDIDFKVTMYPAGRAVGTLSDFARFGQAFVKQETGVLFKRPETWTTLLQPTAYYGETGIPSNSHGFWHLLYENDVYVVGHGGNTIGFSSYLRFDPVSGIGTVVMTNQQGEQVYYTKMQELIFGKGRLISDDQKARISEGYYFPLRSYAEGPLSVIYKLSTLQGYYITKDSKVLQNNFVAPYRSNGIDKLAMPYADFYKLSTSEMTKTFSLLGSWAVALVYALGTLLAGLVYAIYRRIKKQEAKLPKTWRIWHAVNAGLIVLSGLTTLLFFQAASSNSIKTLPYYSMALLVLLIGLFLSLIWALIRRKKFTLTKLQAVRIGLTGLATSALIINILYWSLYQFWVLL